jgi:hypothetical protein
LVLKPAGLATISFSSVAAISCSVEASSFFWKHLLLFCDSSFKSCGFKPAGLATIILHCCDFLFFVQNYHPSFFFTPTLNLGLKPTCWFWATSS